MKNQTQIPHVPPMFYLLITQSLVALRTLRLTVLPTPRS